MTDSAGTIEIRLEDLSKRFPGQKEPAVESLSMEIPKGEIVILVGPSGCGKTTTMKMINRIIEPTSGRIFLDGEDVTKVDPNQLRRRIGYVIQQIGLFPHQTIAENIATVPKMLRWEKRRISERVDELLEMVGMDPGAYRDRYPKELSGGQRQRVGVARAMSADPDVMLMDEPFGAIDPITRDRLQNEFLRLQEEIKKTIIFVTHDIDEAIKMGDRIAILKDRSQIAQFDTPERILVNPADDFVADFIGRGASLKRLSLSRVRDVELDQWPTAQQGAGADEIRRVLEASEKSAVLILDDQHRPLRWVTADHLGRVGGEGGSRDVGLPAEAIVQPNATLSDTLNEMITARYSTAIVVGADRAYQGVVDIDTINATVRSMREAEQGRLRPEQRPAGDGGP
jgi:osmoprotectant transport system ATP-binding protein